MPEVVCLAAAQKAMRDDVREWTYDDECADGMGVAGSPLRTHRARRRDQHRGAELEMAREEAALAGSQPVARIVVGDVRVVDLPQDRRYASGTSRKMSPWLKSSVRSCA